MYTSQQKKLMQLCIDFKGFKVYVNQVIVHGFPESTILYQK